MKVKLKHNYLLLGCVVVLVALCVMSISKPIVFAHRQNEREAVVKRRLLQIGHAQERYRALTGAYTGSFDSLVARGLLADSLQFVPFTDGKRFEMSTTSMVSSMGKVVPMMECRAAYADFLQGLDKQLLQELIDKESTAGHYPGLKIGDLVTPNDNAGNWE